MSIAIYMESTCDKCGAQTRQAHQVRESWPQMNNMGPPPEPPLPHGWNSVRFGPAMARQLCGKCGRELREWLGLGENEAP